MDKREESKPILIGRYWHMPDGGLVPNIYGATGGDDDAASSAASSAATTTTGGDDDAAAATGSGNLSDADLDAMRLKKDLKATRSEAAGYRRKLRELEDSIGDVDMDKYNALLAKETELEQKKLEDKGAYDTLLEDHQRKSEAQLQKSQESTANWKTRFEKQVVDNVLLSAATDKAISAAEAVTLIRSNYKFSVNDAGEVEITGQKGTTMYDEDGNVMAPAAVMSAFLESRPHLCKPTGGGTGSRQSGSPARQQQSSGEPKLHGAARIAAALRAKAGG